MSFRFKALFQLVLFSMLSVLGYSQTFLQENESLLFEKTTINMGKIKEDGGVVSAIFKYKNISKTPIVINTISVSCGCTTTSYSKKPIMAGESGEIKVQYDPYFRPGFFDKSISVYTNSRRNLNELHITGDVIPRVPTVEEQYPFNIGGGVISSSSSLFFEKIPLAISHTLTLDIYNNSGKTVVLDAKSKLLNSKISYYLAAKKLAPKAKTQLFVTINLENSSICEVFDEKISIFVDEKERESVLVSAISVPNQQKSQYKGGSLPVINMPDVYHYFMGVEEGKKVSQRFEILNEGTAPLHIKQVLVTNSDVLSYKLSSDEIAPSSSGYIEVILTPKYITTTGRINEQIIIISNDPAYPTYEMRIAAQLKVK